MTPPKCVCRAGREVVGCVVHRNRSWDVDVGSRDAPHRTLRNKTVEAGEKFNSRSMDDPRASATYHSEAEVGLPEASSSKVTAVAAFADNRTVSPSISPTKLKSM
jgi:hypothetical protein